MVNVTGHEEKICGEFPEFCYKAFKCEDYAKQFIDSGFFHLNCRYYCRTMEAEEKDSARRDPTEGVGHTKELGIVTQGWVSPNPAEKTIWERIPGYQEHHTELGNPVFLFCTSLPPVNLDHMRKNFGRFIVKINNPKKLAEDIYDYFFSIGQKFIIKGCRVVYNKGQKLDRKLADNERIDLSYKQKPESFIHDCEFRIVAIKLGEHCKQECKYLDGEIELKCQYIGAHLNKQLDYTQLIIDEISL